ncbi:MAG: cardiolipin synthase [Gemmataceae bacterium]|nr:cardiolipin synthase [Gemmataceae bacterium]MDW8267390.1 cardiolipin synthase [Gemmataceae bacterium]
MWSGSELRELLQEITGAVAILATVSTVLTLLWVLTIKRDSMSATAWCLVIILVSPIPFLGPLLFLLLGYQTVHRPLTRKQRHVVTFRQRYPGHRRSALALAETADELKPAWADFAGLARRFDAFPISSGNRIEFYHDSKPAFDAKLEAIESARDHIHLEYFIVQPDGTGRRFLDTLARKARAGVEVRLLYDAMGSRRLSRAALEPLVKAGGRCAAFLPLNPLRRRIQVNLRNHRKILVVDGRVAFTGGLNIGDEYLGLVPYYGYWRDTHLKIEGPAVACLQRIFVEDWDFAAQEQVQGGRYFPTLSAAGDCAVQVIQSGPDQALKSIREVFFAAILRAKKRLWIASPYFVPDAGLLNALRLAGYLGVDVRFLGLFHPDKWIPYYAARFYWGDVMDAGIKVYQYTRGMMHAKVMLVDDDWATVGTANLDNRSMHLNFEVNCLFYSPAVVAELEEAFRRDLEVSIQLDREVYAHRPFSGQLIENACRLLSPVL